MSDEAISRSRQGGVYVEWRVVRGDGTEEIPSFWGPPHCEYGARATLEDRLKNGEMGPYRTQRRVVEVPPWEDAALPVPVEIPDPPEARAVPLTPEERR